MNDLTGCTSGTLQAAPFPLTESGFGVPLCGASILVAPRSAPRHQFPARVDACDDREHRRSAAFFVCPDNDGEVVSPATFNEHEGDTIVDHENGRS
jgi:hypothetical protein